MVAPHLLERPEASTAWWAANDAPHVDPPDPHSRALVSLRHAEELAELHTLKVPCRRPPHGPARRRQEPPRRPVARRHPDGTQGAHALQRARARDLSRRGGGDAAWQRPTSHGPRPTTPRALGTAASAIPGTRFSTPGASLRPGAGAPAAPPRRRPSRSPLRRLVLRHWLLALDELQLLDISSAVLLADVLSWFWRMGGVLVATSNKVPGDIYKHGVQRERLAPFVAALETRCPVLAMRGAYDWRQVGYDSESGVREAGRTWLLVGQEEEFQGVLRGFAQDDSAHPRRDYLTLVAHFHTFGIACVPIMPLAAKNQARRFISLIDAQYEARCRLVYLATTPPEELFFPDASDETQFDAAPGTITDNADVMLAEAVSGTRGGYWPNVSPYDSLAMARGAYAPPRAMPLDTLSIFSGQEEQFAFKRAVGRNDGTGVCARGAVGSGSPLPEAERAWERSPVVGTEAHAHMEVACAREDGVPTRWSRGRVGRLLRPRRRTQGRKRRGPVRRGLGRSLSGACAMTRGGMGVGGARA
ncbi:AFG1-like ATPase-domain-containing protein [Mycena sp. CBHHK59/15]|nr:AFG1-like ATPase-domain-containing protein [Mycena sp. CBHHK59/15]